MLTGGCLCGAVRYQAANDPRYAVLCHCRDCQRASGAGHVPVIGVPKESFKVVGPTTNYATAGGSGGQSVRHFCPTCGSLLFGTTEIAPDAVSIYVGTLDDPSLFHPTAALFVRDRSSWDITAGPLPEFATLPPADRR